MILSRKIANLITEKNISADDLVGTLKKYNLLPLLPSILKIAKESTSRTKAGDVIAIESPFVLSPSAVSHIKQITGNIKSPHEVTINKNILAGFKARFKGKLYDGSAERIIRQLTK